MEGAYTRESSRLVRASPRRPKLNTQHSSDVRSTSEATSSAGAEDVVHLGAWLEAQSRAGMTEGDVRILAAHASGCVVCRSLLDSNEEIRRRLALLRIGEPRIDVLRQVLQRIDEEA